MLGDLAVLVTGMVFKDMQFCPFVAGSHQHAPAGGMPGIEGRIQPGFLTALLDQFRVSLCVDGLVGVGVELVQVAEDIAGFIAGFQAGGVLPVEQGLYRAVVGNALVWECPCRG